MKRTIKTILLGCIAVAASATIANAQNFEYRVKAGVSIGGTSPLPLPESIREIKSFRPTLSLVIGGDVVRHIDQKWAVQTGLRFETKGMSTNARVKGYRIAMDITDGDFRGHVDGVFTGEVKTNVKNDYLTMPLVGVYKISNRWDINTGFYFSYLLKGKFDGAANAGYIREKDPTGEKIGVTEASYDFSDEIRKFNWGVQAGARWRAYRQFSVFGDLAWGLNNVFKKDFDGIGMKLYNIYFTMGFAYNF